MLPSPQSSLNHLLEAKTQVSEKPSEILDQYEASKLTMYAAVGTLAQYKDAVIGTA